MTRLGATSHAELVAGLRRHGFEGPFSGGKHLFRIKGELRLAILNPHPLDIAPPVLARILRQAGIAREDWLGD